MSNNTKLLLVLLGGLLLGALFSDYARFGFAGWNGGWFGHHSRGYSRMDNSGIRGDTGSCWDTD